MRRVKLFIATSLDGFIAGPNDEIGWLFTDQDYGLADFFKTVDAALIGRKTYDVMVQLGQTSYKGMRNYVFSRAPHLSNRPDVEYVSDDVTVFVQSLQHEPGKDIWLVGGAALCAPLLRDGLIDDITIAIHPIILGSGIALFPTDGLSAQLEFRKSTAYETGLVMLDYSVKREITSPSLPESGRD